MVAVVDPAAEFGIEVGAAAPSSVPAGLVQHYPVTALGQHDRRRKAGKPGPDHVH